MKVTAKVDFISLDFGNVKQGQLIEVKQEQAKQLLKLGVINELPEPSKKKGK